MNPKTTIAAMESVGPRSYCTINQRDVEEMMMFGLKVHSCCEEGTPRNSIFQRRTVSKTHQHLTVKTL